MLFQGFNHLRFKVIPEFEIVVCSEFHIVSHLNLFSLPAFYGYDFTVLIKHEFVDAFEKVAQVGLHNLHLCLVSQQR
jgi:hypothetical protein